MAIFLVLEKFFNAMLWQFFYSQLLHALKVLLQTHPLHVALAR